jgi:hypothetical protein
MATIGTPVAKRPLNLKPTANADFAVNPRNASRGLTIEARFCPEDIADPFDTVEWDLRVAAIKGESGEVLFEQGNHKDAVRNFFLVAYGFSDSGAPETIRGWQAAALFESGRCFEVLATRADAKSEAGMKYLEQAKKLYAELLEKYPKSDKADLAKRRLAELEKGG